MRAHRAGWKILFVPDAKVVHQKGLAAKFSRSLSNTPVEVFDMEEILLIEGADFRDHFPTRHHAGAGNCLNLDWTRNT
jgi:hypothetical protein